MALATTAAAAATAAGLAYLDAKLHIRKDIANFRSRARVQAGWEQAVKDGRTSPYYFIEGHAAAKGNTEAVWSRAGCYSWSEVLEHTNRYAQWFLARGVKPGSLVALYMTNSPDFFFAWLGLWAIGAAPALINYHLTGGALVHCLGVSGARLILVDGDEAAAQRIEEVRAEMEQRGGAVVVHLESVRAEIRATPPTRPGDELRKGITAGSPFGLFYTSGTTGMPKAVPLPIVAAFGNGYGRKAKNRYASPDDRWYVCMPLYHGTGGITSMLQVLGGVTVCVAPRFSASGFWSDVRDSRATWFCYVGETLRYLLAAPPSALDRQHRVHSILGNGLRPDVWRRFRDRFGVDRVIEFFNSSEGVFGLENASRNDFTVDAVGHHGFLQRWKYHHSFVPVAVDYDTGDIVRDPATGFATRMPYDEGGEILVAMPFERPFAGYWNNPDATEKRFARDVFRRGDCYYRTGDALRRDTEGRWYFLDRLGDTFRWKGENVSTAEVSEVLGRYPGVLEANVYGVHVPGHDGKAGAAAISVDPGKGGLDHRGFLRHARTHLPKYAVPLFLRYTATPSSMHNNKQNKAPLKRDGVDPDKVGRSGGDALYWIEGRGRGDTYVPFTAEDWASLGAGKAKL